MDETVSNTPELSVSDLAGALKRTIEDAFGQVRLRGEISGYRGPHSSGHVYFSLKDQNARIDAVIWKGVFSRIKFRPEDGLEVIATGRITTFPGKSSYQIIIEQMEPAGVGALMALLEERRRKLQAEGVFDSDRKRTLPFLPTVIGIVTSPTGAVIRDMIHRLSDRFPREVLVWPVRVQGETSAAEVAAAIRGFNALPIGPEGGLWFSEQGERRIPRPEVIIVARGGGSLEDLWGFNEEIVVRAAAESEIPLISAIGHETDWTLLDLVADIRAPTPTAAAEMVVPVRADLVADVRAHAARLAGGIARLQERHRRDLANLSRALPSPERALEGPRQRLDRAVIRQAAALRTGLDRRSLALGRLAHRLGTQTPAARLASIRAHLMGLGGRLPGLAARQVKGARQALDQMSQRFTRALSGRLALENRDAARRAADLAMLGNRLEQAVHTRLARQQQALAARAELLGSLGYRRVLARGYTVVRDENAAILGRSAAVQTGQRLSIEFADGQVDAVAGLKGALPPTGTLGAAKPVSARSAKAKPTPGDQGSLF